MKLKVLIAIYSALMFGLLFPIATVLVKKNILISNNKGISAIFMYVIYFILTVFIGFLIFRKKNK